MRPSTRIAVAATALVAVFALMSWLLPGGGVSVAFADVAEALNKVHSATWKSTTVEKVKEPQSKTYTTNKIEMYLAPLHERTETTFSGGGKLILIFDGQKNRGIYLDSVSKTGRIRSGRGPKEPAAGESSV